MTDTISPVEKSHVTRKSNQLAGARPALPGQNHLREAYLRAELIADFGPTNRVEMIWLGDIAYCMAAIEVIRSQIAGFRMLKVKQAYKDVTAPHPFYNEKVPDGPEEYDTSIFSERDYGYLDYCREENFRAPVPRTFLGDKAFSLLLGKMTPNQAAQLRQLEQAMFEQSKERDRIINQIDRRRRQLVRDVIERDEARRAETEGEPLLGLFNNESNDLDADGEEDEFPVCDVSPAVGVEDEGMTGEGAGSDS